MKEAQEEDFELNFVREIIFIAKEMGGWPIDHILHMPILRYTAVREALKHSYDEQNREADRLKENKLAFR